MNHLEYLTDQVHQAQQRYRAKEKIKELLQLLPKQDQYDILIELAEQREET